MVSIFWRDQGPTRPVSSVGMGENNIWIDRPWGRDVQEMVPYRLGHGRYSREPLLQHVGTFTTRFSAGFVSVQLQAGTAPLATVCWSTMVSSLAMLTNARSIGGTCSSLVAAQAYSCKDWRTFASTRLAQKSFPLLAATGILAMQARYVRSSSQQSPSRMIVWNVQRSLPINLRSALLQDSSKSQTTQISPESLRRPVL